MTSPRCQHEGHPDREMIARVVSAAALERAARMFGAMGDPARLRLLELLSRGELCVTEIVAGLGEKFTTVSQRLRLLHREQLVARRREGKHIFYALTDRHVADLLFNALAHASEGEGRSAGDFAVGNDRAEGGRTMSQDCALHQQHSHQHGAQCGHTAVKHEGHVDYLHDGHLHHVDGAGVAEHAIGVTGANPSACTPNHQCGAHAGDHVHGAGCGHEAVPHGDHVDYLVDGHLHHPHGGHCDDHGKLDLA